MNSKQKQAMSEALAERFARYAAQIVAWTAAFPDTKEGKHIHDQLLRSATAPGAHYAEARGAQSRADFVHKLSLALKEIRESVHWLRVAYYSGFTGDARVELTLREAEELAAILTASQTTARGGS